MTRDHHNDGHFAPLLGDV